MTTLTIADLARPEAKRQALLYDAALVIGGSMLIALSALVAFRIGPVPVSAQTLAVVLIGATLGSKRGALAVMAYLMEGMAGLPVFTHGGANVPMTFGYIVGFIGAAYLVGLLAEQGWDRKMWKTMVMMAAGHVVIFASGLAWLYMILGVGVQKTLAAGLYPFLPGCVLKVLLATALLPVAWKVIKRRG
ncbi:MAG: biotin transporter BioY [Candidatus Sumerlaeia bacterium]